MSLRVLFCASEVAPWAKTGGLADVAGSLPVALAKIGVEVLIVLPRYRGLPETVPAPAPGVRVRFVENEGYFNRSGLYGNESGDYADNLERFSYFCNEALLLARDEDFRPDIVHVNDWQTALIPAILKSRFRADSFFSGTKTLLTIHNLAYQGIFASKHYPELGLDPDFFSMDGFEFYGKINLLKGGLLFADAIGTVSPTYAREMQTHEFGFGLDGVIRRRADRMKGILNGIDADLWDPAREAKTAERFSADKPEGKAACKADLQKRMGLEVDPAKPLFGAVTRLAEQKGLELLSEICDKLVEKGGQFVLLGDGDAVYKTQFKAIMARHSKAIRAEIGFDNDLARKIYAGSDFFLMPSYFEPCGLGQMIALKYGSLPVVRKTGGLADTIVDADENAAGNGFAFKDRTPEALWKAVERAFRAWSDAPRLAELRQRAMRADFSWKRSAEEYRDFYGELLGRRAKEAAA